MCVHVCVCVYACACMCVYMRVFVCQERGKKGRSAAYGCIFACLFHYAFRISGLFCASVCMRARECVRGYRRVRVLKVGGGGRVTERI